MRRHGITRRRRKNKKKCAAMKMVDNSPMNYVGASGAPLSSDQGADELSDHQWSEAVRIMGQSMGPEGQWIQDTYEDSNAEGRGDAMIGAAWDDHLKGAVTGGIYNSGNELLYNVVNSINEKKKRDIYNRNWTDDAVGASEI